MLRHIFSRLSTSPLANPDLPLFYIHPGEPQTRFFHLLGRMGLDHLYSQTRRIKHGADLSQTYVPVQVMNLDFLGDPQKLFSDRQRSLINKTNVRFFFDMSIEAITFEGYSSRKLLEFHQMIRDIGLAPERVVFLSANAKAESYYGFWAEQQGITDTITMLGYHFYLFEYAWELALNMWFQKHASHLVEVAKKPITQQEKRDAYFMCLNLRPRCHRSAIVLHLMDRGWLDKGIVTYFGEAFGNQEAVSVDRPEDTQAFIATLPSADRLLAHWDELNQKCPLTFERDATEVRNDLWHRKPGEVDFLIPEVAQQQGNVERIDSYFEIVNETWFTGGSNLYITEKTIRAIIRLQPFIHVGSPHLLDYLRSIGFKTFAPYIDESYDAMDDKTERMEAIFKEIDRLCAMSEDDMHRLYGNLWPVLEHNFHHFQSHIKQVCSEEVQANILGGLA